MRQGKAPNQRQLRVGELLRHALAELFTRGDLRDPDLSDVTITVVEVSVGPDLKNATAFVMPLGGGDAQRVIEALNRSKKFIRGHIGQQVLLKHMPNIAFELDRSFDYSDKIDSLLTTPHVSQDLKD
jgi:ribosome-binding factor A